MINTQFDQVIALAKKATLSPEETAVLAALRSLSDAESTVSATVKPVPAALAEAQDVIEDAQEALDKTPSTTV